MIDVLEGDRLVVAVPVSSPRGLMISCLSVLQAVVPIS